MRDKTKHPAEMRLITLRNYWFNFGSLTLPNKWFPIDITGYTTKNGRVPDTRVWDSRPRE